MTPPPPSSTDYDVVVVGGGPAGSTVASLVAQDGHRVALLERETFPRYHVGESLLIGTWDIFDALGVTGAVEGAGFVEKPGGTFLWGGSDRAWSVYFSEVDPERRVARQVERAEFDAILLKHAAASGAEVHEGVPVTGLVRENGRVRGVTAELPGGVRRLSARFVVDASGRWSRLTRGLVRRSYPDDFRAAAVWAYFRGARPLSGPEAGNVLNATFPWGWFWFIPLRGGVTSVGAVMDVSAFRARGHTPAGREALFQAAVEASPEIRARLAGAQRISPHRSCADYSRDSARYHADGFLLVGDAACFIDPILATGVHLAMSGACYAAFGLNRVLRGGDEARALSAFERYYRSDYRLFLNISREHYDLNGDRGEPFWRAHRLPDDDGGRSRARRDRRLAFVRLISGISGGLEQRNELGRKHVDDMYDTFGLGRYRDPAFLAQRPRLRGWLAAARPGYAMAGAREGAFREVEIVPGPEGSEFELYPADRCLLELCDGTRTVEDVLRGLRLRFDLRDVSDGYLAESVGAWVDRGLLEPVPARPDEEGPC